MVEWALLPEKEISTLASLGISCVGGTLLGTLKQIVYP
jgi:hypothetical protein